MAITRERGISQLTLCSSIALAVAGALAGTQAAAQPVTLETVVIQTPGDSPVGPDRGVVARRSRSVSKTDTPLVETPQAVNVVNREQMTAQAASSVAEALRYTPGVIPDPQGADIRFDWLRVRGFDTFGAVWMDGLALAGDYSSWATPRIEPYALERVEVIKGPASVLYGAGVPGGLVNLVSKRPQDKPANEVTALTTGWGGMQVGVDSTGPLDKDGRLTYRFVGLARNLKTHIDHERNRTGMIAPSLRWKATDDTAVTVFGMYQKDDHVFSPRFYPTYGSLLDNPNGPNVPRDLYLGEPDADTFNRTLSVVGYEVEHALDANWTLNHRLRYSHSKEDMFLVRVHPFAPWAADGHTLNRVSAISDDWLKNLNVDTNVQGEFQAGGVSHTLLAGFDYLHARRSLNFANSAVGVPPLDVLDPQYGQPVSRPTAFTSSSYQNQKQYGLYLQDQIRSGNWVGTVGLRHDRVETKSHDRIWGDRVDSDDSATTGRLGVTYRMENGWAPYASAMTSFQPVSGTDRTGKPFEPLKARQIEIGAKYDLPGGDGTIAISAFDLRLDNALTPDPADAWFNVQTGRQRIRGLEFEGKYQLLDRIELTGSYAYSDSKILRSTDPVQKGREMLTVPEHQASVWMRYSLAQVPGLAVSGGVRYVGSYQTDSTYMKELRIPARTLADVGLDYDFGSMGPAYAGTRLQLNVTNLFDKTYVTHCINLGANCNYGEPRKVTLQLTKAW